MHNFINTMSCSLGLFGAQKCLRLSAFAADIFFDDQPLHCEAARDVVATGHVPHGVVNAVLAN